MINTITKKIKKSARHQLASLVLRGDTSVPAVKEILQGAKSHAIRIGFSGKPNTSGFSPSFGTTRRSPGGYEGAKTLVVDSFTTTTTSKGRDKSKHAHNYTHRMTRAWAENLAGQWLNANRRDDTPFSGVC